MRRAAPHPARFCGQDSRHSTAGQALRKWPYKVVQAIMTDPGRIGTRQEFADELSLLKDHAGLTVRDIAAKTGIPPSTLGGYFAGSHLPPAKMTDLLPSILSVCGVDDAAQRERWLAALARVRRAPGRRPAGAAAPYRGLKSFQPEDAEWFFGRLRLTEILLGRLRDQRPGELLTVVGPSGSGKSSLLRAGLIPAVRSGALGDCRSGLEPAEFDGHDSGYPPARPVRRGDARCRIQPRRVTAGYR
jgi:Novel STAND NTPase 1/Helix-turn-helix domain